MMGSIVVIPLVEERNIINDHFQAIMALDKQITDLRTQFHREKRDLEVAYQNAVRREMLQEGRNGEIPPFFGSDGQLNMRFNEDGSIGWIEGREGPTGLQGPMVVIPDAAPNISAPGIANGSSEGGEE